VREALFSSLGARVAGAAVLDLFGGSGALGIEALSRGAASAVIVERDRRAADVIAANLARTGLAAQARLVRGDALAALRGLAARNDVFDVVFIDPPYRSDLAARALGAIVELGLLAADGVVVVEHDKRAPAPPADGLLPYAERSYGDTRLTYLARPR
jgi:16S rRNA (guanine(966)-N(2))-methyltransferase RsmD